VAQPSLTRAIKMLEEEFGGDLFRRERNLTHLTDLGRLMQPRLTKAYEEAAAARQDALSFLKLEKAPLNLGVMCTIGPGRLIDLIANFRWNNPGIDLHLQESTPERLLERLLQGEIDVALLAKPGGLEERFDLRPLYRERFVIAFPPGHRFEQKNAIEIHDLEGESYLPRLNCEYFDYLADLRKTAGVKITYGYSSEREDWIQSMVMAGLGICFMPEYTVATPGVQTRPLINPEVMREIGIATIAGRRHSPAVAALMRQVSGYRWNKRG
jgi:DNA-binding transcriptional LysR family regulator